MATALVKFKFTFDKGKVFRNRIKGWRNDLKDLRWAWPVVELAVVEWHRRIFDSEGATSLVSGGAWKPLSEVTIMSRLRQEKVSPVPEYDYLAASPEGPEGRVLHWAHRLRNAVAADKRTGDSVRVATRKSFEFGGATEYGDLHQRGGTNRWGKTVAARPWLDFEGGPAVAIGMLDMALQARWSKS